MRRNSKEAVEVEARKKRSTGHKGSAGPAAKPSGKGRLRKMARSKYSQKKDAQDSGAESHRSNNPPSRSLESDNSKFELQSGVQRELRMETAPRKRVKLTDNIPETQMKPGGLRSYDFRETIGRINYAIVKDNTLMVDVSIITQEGNLIGTRLVRAEDIAIKHPFQFNEFVRVLKLSQL